MTTAMAMAATPAAAAGEDATVGEVVVTAQFREQSLQSTPIAITAVNAQMLENRSQSSVYEVAAQAPNVTLKPAGAAFGPSLQASIRGVGQYDFSFALEPGVGLYADDVYYSTLTGSILDLLDLDRIEILRGPQGTLAGKNSIGGAVKLYSKKPTGSNSGYVEATYGSLNRVDARGSADFAIVPDKLLMRLSAVTRHHDGYVSRLDYACTHPGSGLPTAVIGNNCKLGTEGGQSMNAVRAAVRWLASDKVEVNIIGDFTNDTSEVQASTLLAAKAVPLVPEYGPQFVPTNPYVSYSTFTDTTNPYGAFSIPPVNGIRSWGTSGTIDWQIADSLSMKLISAYRSYTSDFAEDTDGSPTRVETVMNHVSHHQFSEEIRFNGSLGSTIDYTVGGFYFRQLNRNANRVDIGYAGLDFASSDPVLSHTKAGFAHAEWHITDALTLDGGARYTVEDKDYTYSRLNPDGSVNPILGPLTGAVGHYEGSRWDWRVNASYKITPDVMVYAQASTGFKGGGVNPRPFVPTQVQPFGPETLTAYEGGIKTELFDRRMRLNLAAFFNKYDSIQLTLLSCPTFSPPIPGFPCALPQNAGDADVSGFEVETEIHPIDGLQIDGSLSYLHFKYTRIDPLAGGPAQPAGVQFGMVSPFTPKWKWSVGVQYEIPVGDKGTLTPRLDANFQDKFYANAVNGPQNLVNGYTLLNARLTWRAPDRDWEASLEVTNLTDKLYYYQKFDLYNLAGFTNGQPGVPREWALTVKKYF